MKALLALLAAGCGVATVDPCAGITQTCLGLQVRGTGSIDRVDALHFTIGVDGAVSERTASDGKPKKLPLAVAIVFDSPPAASFEVQVHGRGSLAGTIVGEGTTTRRVARGEHATVTLTLSSMPAEDMAVRDLQGPVDDLAVTEDLATIADLAAAPPDLAEEDLTTQDFTTQDFTTQDLTTQDLTAVDLLMPDFAITPILTLSVLTPPASVNLTTEGTIDWVHLGRQTSSDVNRKNVTNVISLTVNGNKNGLTATTTSFSWTDGTPTASESGTINFIRVGNVGENISVSVPATGTTRKLRIYAGVDEGTGRLTVTMSDGALPMISDTLIGTGTPETKLYEITFRNAAPSVTVTAVWSLFSESAGSGAASYKAASLQ